MQCTCVRQADLPNASKLFTDLIYHYDRVADLYAFPTNDIEAIRRAAAFGFPAARRAASVEAIRSLNTGNPNLDRLAEPDTVAVITGQQVGLFSGPVYTIYKALTAIRIAAELTATGTPAVPMFWLATEDHDFAEVDHAFAFGPDHQPVRLNLEADGGAAPRPVGQRTILRTPLEELRVALGDLPCAEEAVALAARTYQPGETLGSAFAKLLRELFAPYGLLFIDPMLPALRTVAAPLMRSAVEQMPDLTRGIMDRSAELVRRGYHAQVLVDDHTSLVFKLRDGERLVLRRTKDGFADHSGKYSVNELAAHPEELSPNALLRPVAQDYMFPTAAYVGGAAELAYLAQSAVLYDSLLGRRPVAFPRAGFTVVDERASRRMHKYRLSIPDLFRNERELSELIATRLVPRELRQRLDTTKSAIAGSLDSLDADLRRFDVSQSKALSTSRRKIEHQIAKITRKTALQILAKDEQAAHHAASLTGLVYPDGHLQERVYSILPMLARFGPNFIPQIYKHVRVDCPDHQFAIA